MSRARVVHCFLCLILFFGIIGSLAAHRTAFATTSGSNSPSLSTPNQEQPATEDKLELSSLYPVLREISGETFYFNVDLKWYGSTSRRFDLSATAPPNWRAIVLREFEEKEAPAIELTPGKEIPDTVRVGLAPMAGEEPEPGEYVVTLEASSGSIRETIELKAIVTDLYRYAFYTAMERLNTEVTAGDKNELALIVFNTGTADIERITFSSSKPSGWKITFEPEEIDSVAPGLSREVNMIIEPPAKTIAGDYSLTLKALSMSTAVPARELDLRVTVLTPTIWGWVGILIVLAVIAGVGVIFWRLGRR